MTAVIIEKSKTTQLRIEATEYKGKAYMDVREFAKWGDNTEFRHTKSGVTIPPERVDEVIAALEAQKSKLAKTVVQVDGERDAYLIVKSVEDVVLAKAKHIFDDEDTATGKAPPDGFKLYRVKIKDGVVVKHKLLYVRKNNRWKEPEAKKEVDKKAAAKVVKKSTKSR